MAALYKVLGSNGSDNVWAERAAKTATPSGLAATTFRPGAGGGWYTEGVRNLYVQPYGAGADNATLSFRFVGWRQTQGGLWVPGVLCEVDGTLCASVGVAGQDVGASERFCDTLSLVTNLGNSNVSVEVFSPQNNTPGHLLLDTKGAEYVELLVKVGTATSGNALAGVL